MSRLAAFFALFSFTAALLTEAGFGVSALFTHSVRVYPVECEGQVVFGTFCEGELSVPLDPVTFRAALDRQRVTKWESEGTTDLSNCTVKDYRNWQCTRRTGRDLIIQKTLQDGRLEVNMYDSSMSPKTNVNSWDLIYVPAWEWLRRDLEYEMPK